MVGHIVIGIVGDDKVGVDSLDHVNHFVPGFFVVIVDMKIVESAPDHFIKSAQSTGAFCFALTHDGKFVPGNNYVAVVTVAQMARKRN